ncbi:hypothetical protein [Synechococcus sp. MIT S1220]
MISEEYNEAAKHDLAHCFETWTLTSTDRWPRFSRETFLPLDKT